MSDHTDPVTNPGDLDRFAEVLKKLAPQPPNASRDALLFAAGKASTASKFPVWLWPATTGFFAATSLVLSVFLAMPGQAAVHVVEKEKVVYREATRIVPPDPPPALPAPSEPVSPDPDHELGSAENLELAQQLRVRREVFRFGIEMLPSSNLPPSSSRDVTRRDLNRWLNIPSATYALPGNPPKSAPKVGDNDE